MKTDVWAFVVEHNAASNAIPASENQERNLNVLRSCLQGICSEAFVWPVKNHLAIWTTGADVIQLLNVFFKNVHPVDTIQLLQGTSALDYLLTIANGLSWQDCSSFEKLASFKESYLYAHIRGQLGPVLSPVVDDGLSALVKNPWVAASTNSCDVLRKMTKSVLDIHGVEQKTREELLRHNLN